MRSGEYRRRTAASLATVALVAATGLAACGDTGGGGGSGGGGGPKDFDRPVTLIVPFGPGSGTDAAARLVSPVLEKELGVPFPVVNVPGATGNTGITKLLQSRPSETIAATAADTLATVPGGTSTFQLHEITPVCRLSLAPSYLFVNTKSKYKSWDDLSKAVKARPGEITVATVGRGGIDDIMLGALAQKGFKFRNVPFAESGERKNALLSGDVVAMYEQAGDVRENLESDQFKPVLMFGSEKSALEADYTLSSEIGVTDVIDQWRGLIANADMPEGQVQTLSQACGKAEGDPGFGKFRNTAWESEGAFMPQAEFRTFVADQLKTMESLGKQYGIYK